MKALNKACLAAGMLGSLAILGGLHAAEPENLEQANKDLKIMRNIFQTVLDEQHENTRIAFHQQPEARYLAGQGMVFTFNMQTMRSQWPIVIGSGQQAIQLGRQQLNQTRESLQQLGEELALMSEELKAQMQDTFEDIDFDFDSDVDYNYNFEYRYEPFESLPRIVQLHDPSLTNQQREMMSRMIEDIRRHQEDVQEQQHRIRDRQRELRARDGNEEELRETIAGMEAELEPMLRQLEEKHQTYEAYMRELEAQNAARMEQVNQEFTASIMQGLCDYGATIRSLPEDEHISLIFEDYAEDQDRVFILEYADVAQCTSAEDLRAGAVSYLL